MPDLNIIANGREHSSVSEVSAYHEAGHALMALIMGGRVLRVSLDPEQDEGPDRYADIEIEWSAREFTARELAERSLQVALAGPVAEMIHTGDPFHPGLVAEWASDWELAWVQAATLIPDERKRLAYLERKTQQIYHLLHQDRQWSALSAVVDSLLAHETLEGEEVEEIVLQWGRLWDQ